MEMENSRRSFERWREMGLKKPKLSEESSGDPNQSSRTFPQRPGLLPSRLKAGELEDSNRVSYEQQQQQQQQQQQHHHDLVDRYRTALRELTFNSKPIITNLTIIAGENLDFAKAISATVCANILEVTTDRKLPSLYLLDSIVKNIGKDYIEHFAAKLPEVFCKAYKQVDSVTHQSMQHLFGTWKEIFPLEPLQAIENQLRFNTINRMSSSATSSRSDFQSQRPPPHSIHVNPKYLEARQRFQQSTRNSQMSSSKDVRDEPVIEKDATVSYGDSDDGRGPGISRSLGLGLQRGGGLDDPRQENNKKRYRGGETMTPVSLQSNGLAGKHRPLNYSQMGAVQADVFMQNNQIRESKSGIATSKSWKNSEEEEYTWNDPGMNDKQSFSMKEDRASGDSGILEFKKSQGKQQNLPRTGYNMETDISTDSLSTAHRGRAFTPNHYLTTQSRSDTRFRDDPVQIDARSRNVLEENDTMDENISDFLPKISKPHAYSRTSNSDLPNVRTVISGQHLPPTHEVSMSSFPKTPSSLPFSSRCPDIQDGMLEDNHTWYQPGVSGQQQPTNKGPFTSQHKPFPSHNPNKHDGITENDSKLYSPRGFDSNDVPVSMHMNSGQIHHATDYAPLKTQNLHLQRTRFNLKSQVPYSPEFQPDVVDCDHSTDVQKFPQVMPSRSSSDNLKPSASKFVGNYDLNASVKKNRILSNTSVMSKLQNLCFQETESVSHQQTVQPSLLTARHHPHQFTSSRPMVSDAPFSSHESPSNSSASSDHSKAKRKKQSSFLSGQGTSLLSGPGAASSPDDTTTFQKNSNADSKVGIPVSSLLSKLMAKGLISPSKPEVTDSSSLDISQQKLSECTGIADICSTPTHTTKINLIPLSTPNDAVPRDVNISTVLEPGCDDFKNMIGFDFRPKVLREFHPKVVDDLFEDLPHTCYLCSSRMRFNEQLERHMEWHDLKGVAPGEVGSASRQWYVDASEWMKPPYLLEYEPSVVETEIEEAKDLQMVPADESQCVCFFCGEIFKDFYSFERDEWMFKDAMHMEIPSEYHQYFGDRGDAPSIVHTDCVSDVTFEMQNQMEMLGS